MKNKRMRIEGEAFKLARSISRAQDSGCWDDVSEGWAVDLAFLVLQSNALLRIESWKKTFEDSFDLAVAVTNELDLYEMCEVNGDRTFIPIWIQKLCKEALA